MVITTGGLGKRVPVSQFRLQNRAGMGLRSIKFRKPNDQLAALQIVGEDDEMILITSRGIIIRQSVNAISCQSRMATGVQVQRLDEDDAIVAVALVPPETEGEFSADEEFGADELETGEPGTDELEIDNSGAVDDPGAADVSE